MGRLRSIAKRLVLVVLLGAATTVAVAWLLAAFLPHTHLRWRRNVVGDPRQYISVFEFSRPGMVRRTWRAGYAGNAPAMWSELQPSATIQLRNGTVDQDRSWGDLAADLAHPTKNSQGAEDARGWPFLCLWCTIDEGVIEGGAAGRPVRGGFPMSRVNTTSTSGRFRALPMFPIWKGLAADAAVYTGAWAILIPAFYAARSAMRRRRGLCPCCAYNLKHLPERGCSECGWNRSAGDAD